MAAALTRLGDIHHATNNPDAAHDAWQGALVILTELQHPDAITMHTKLNAAPREPLGTSVQPG